MDINSSAASNVAIGQPNGPVAILEKKMVKCRTVKETTDKLVPASVVHNTNMNLQKG
jgi:hypothetical protein